MRRTRYFSSLLWLFFRSVASLCLTLAFIASLTLAWQLPKIERELSEFLAKSPARRGAILAQRLEQNALVARASIGSLLIEDRGAAARATEEAAEKLAGKALVLNEISLESFAKITIFCKSLKINWLTGDEDESPPLYNSSPSLSSLFLPSSAELNGLQIFVPRASLPLATPARSTSSNTPSTPLSLPSPRARMATHRPYARLARLRDRR